MAEGELAAGDLVISIKDARKYVFFFYAHQMDDIEAARKKAKRGNDA